MKRIAVFVVLLSFIFMSSQAVAGFKKIRIYPKEGQTEEQQEQDRSECHDLAVKETGVDPDILEMRLDGIESMQSRAAIPRGKSLTLSPSKASEVSEYQDKIDAVNKQYKEYLKVFSEAMEARGYKVK
jgi:hypothetical protein